MTRDAIYAEMQDMLGLVPTMFQSMSDTALQRKWELYKAVDLTPGPIPPKYCELIGLGIAGATRSR